ncbi:MAG: DUF4123 domain-containing protein [Marinobacter sp.]|nr:DUF4123 domain-containing protein [Marinobacter sp.]
MLDVFDAPSGVKLSPADVQADYILIDGSKRAEGERWLYELFDTPDYCNLFDGTEWAQIRQVAPLLVRVEQGHPGLESLLMELQALECGYGLISHESLDTVASHLRQFIQVRHPLGHSVFLRFSDPAVARVLLAPSKDGGMPGYWSMINGVQLPDSLWDGWYCQRRDEAWTPDNGKTQAASVATMYLLSDLTLTHLADVDRRVTLIRLVRHLDTYFPGWLANERTALRIDTLRHLINEAISNGYTSVQALTHWCTAFGCLGDLAAWDRVAPAVYRLFQTCPRETGGAEARQAALMAMELAQTHNAGRAEQWEQ